VQDYDSPERLQGIVKITPEWITILRNDYEES
jgi:hypothetical protein